MKYAFLIICLLAVVACGSVRTDHIKIDKDLAANTPPELALDRLLSFTKTTKTMAQFKCTFNTEGVAAKSGGPVVPYDKVKFRFGTNAQQPGVVITPHLFFIDEGGVAICDFFLCHDDVKPEQCERRFKHLGEALVAMGAEFVQ